MKEKPLMSRMLIGAVATLGALTATAALALDTAALDKEVAATLNHFYALAKNNQCLEQNAAAVLVFPRVTKAGVGVGGEHGDGALLENGKTVGYYATSGASIGLTLGVSRHKQSALLRRSGMGSAASVSIGSVGVSAGTIRSNAARHQTLGECAPLFGANSPKLIAHHAVRLDWMVASE